MKKVIMTVDVEGHDGSDPVTHLIMGKTVDGTSYGIGKLMDIFDYHHIIPLSFSKVHIYYPPIQQYRLIRSYRLFLRIYK